MTIGDKIKRLREANRMTQEELASYINSTKQTIYKYENSIITNIPSDKIENMAKILNTSPAYLMGWDSPDKKLSSIINDRITALGITLEQVATNSNVPLSWLENIDTFIPGEDDYKREERELDWDGVIGWSQSYDWITRVAEVLRVPGAALRSALARQEINAYDGPTSTAEEDFDFELEEDNNTPHDVSDIESKPIKTIAAHFKGKQISEEKLRRIEKFIEFTLNEDE